ncbi:MAG: DoxX family protein [Bacteroides sp.]|nr:DoxX family protein [Bacteroides sp.]
MPSSQSSSSPRRIDVIYHPALVWLVRVIIGSTFILSGFVKSIDPWGSFYKIAEYIDVWGLDVPSSLEILAAFALGGVEFVLGCLVLLGCYRRVAVWLLTLMMAFMLPLTLYIAMADPVADCGCFGDFIILSNTATFVKNIFITLLLVYLLMFNSRVDGLFNPYVQWIVGGLVSLYIVIISLIGFNIQPLIDFRRFAPGVSLLPSDDDDDSASDVDYEFIYEKDGERRSFTIDSLPDSTWTFVDRKVIGGGNEEMADGFSVIVDGEDIAADIIDPTTDQFLVTVPDLRGVDLSYTYLLNELNDYMTGRGGSMVALVNGDDDDIDWWRDISMASYPIYSAEPTMIKELARGKAAIIYLHEGVVVWKRTVGSISYSALTGTPPGQLLHALDPEPTYILYVTSITFAGIIFIIMMLDRSGRLVAWHIRRRKHTRQWSHHETADGDTAENAPKGQE